jgi:single-strand DNA-binding protein
VVWNRQNGASIDEKSKITCCISVAAWHWLAESCYQFLRKGNGVVVEGELQSKSWTSENGECRSFIELKARRIQFMNRSHDHGNPDLNQQQNSADETVFVQALD